MAKNNQKARRLDHSGSRPNEHPCARVDAVVIPGQPMPQKVKRLTNVKLIHYIYFC